MGSQAQQPLRLRLRLKVRTQLIVIFSGLLLALVLVAFATAYALFEQSEYGLWSGRQRDAAQSVAIQVSNLIDQAQGILTAMAGIGQAALANNPLQAVLETNSALNELAIIAPDGRIIARAFRDSDALFANAESASSLEWFQKSLEMPQGLFYIGEVEPRVARAPTLLIATRAANGFMAAAVLNMGILNDIAARVRFGETGVAYIVEAEGPLVAHSDPAWREKLINLAGRPELPVVEDQPFIGRLSQLGDEAQAVHTSEYTNFKGEDVLGTTYVVEGTDLVVFVESAQSEIHAGQNRAFVLLTLALGTALLLAVVIVRQVIKRGIEVPIERLREGAQRVAQGDLTYQVPISYRDEIGEVTEAFNAMTDQLRERTLQKARQDIRLRAFYEVAARSGDIDTQLQAALEMGVTLLGLEIGSINQVDGSTSRVLYVHSTLAEAPQRGQRLPLSQAYCDLTYQTSGLVSVERMSDSPYREHPCYTAMRMETYVGVPLSVGGKRFGTLSFASRAPRQEPFTAFDKDFFLLIGEWVSGLLERKQGEQALLRRDAILAALAENVQQLLAAPSWEDSIQDILAHLGRATSASRVYIFQARRQGADWLADQRFEWCAAGIPPRLNRPELQGVNLSQLFPDRIGVILAGQPIGGAVRNLPERERAILERQQIVSILILPILIDGQLWGFIGFDECTGEHTWDALEIELLRTVAADLSATIKRQQQERELRRSRERLLQIANNLQGAIYEFFVEGEVWRIGYITQGIYALAGITAEEIMADFDTFARLIHPEDLKPFVESVNAVLIDRSTWRFEGRLFHKQTGELRWWRAESVPTVDENGRVVFKGVIFDITDRRNAEEQVQRQNEALVKANRELAVARRQAELASKLKSQFLATMSHELRTPLNAIIGYAQLQLAGIVGVMTPEQLGYQERILINAQHLLHLINDILDLSKIEAGRMELAEKPFSLRACLGEVMTQNKVLADSKGLAFVLEVDDRLPDTIIGDFGRIKQIAINLVSNAIKFTDRGSVQVKADLVEGNNMWRLTVADTGVGIPSHQQEIIFDEFLQAENGLDRGGSGLGLAIVRKLVLAMRGTIRVSSEVGRGSTFTVTLPLVTEKDTTQMLSAISEG
jgi:PAS domain S-box-containing protein